MEAQKTTTPAKMRVPQPADTIALVFQLEKMALPGQRVLFEASKKSLGAKKIEISAVSWARFGVDADLACGLNRLLSSASEKSFCAKKLADEIQSLFLREISCREMKFNSAMKALVEDALKSDFMICALSFLPEGAAKKLLAPFDPDERIGLHVAGSVAKDRAHESWRAACKAVGTHPRCSVALVDTAASARAALVAGMKVIAIPDEFSGFQDFGGVDKVVEDLKTLSAKDLLALLRPCGFRGKSK